MFYHLEVVVMINEITNELQAQMGSRTFVSSYLPFFIKLTLENGGDVFMIGDQYVDVTEIDLLIKAISELKDFYNKKEEVL
jgi:hypothetical protein